MSGWLPVLSENAAVIRRGSVSVPSTGASSASAYIGGANRADRYATNKALRDTLTFNAEHIYVANGRTLVDALTSSPLAARSGAAVMLTPMVPADGVDPLMKVYAFGTEAAP
jgi:hypothetical protein